MYKEGGESSSSGLKNQDTTFSIKIVFLNAIAKKSLDAPLWWDPIPVPKEGIAAHAHANNDDGERGRYKG